MIKGENNSKVVGANSNYIRCDPIYIMIQNKDVLNIMDTPRPILVLNLPINT